MNKIKLFFETFINVFFLLLISITLACAIFIAVGANLLTLALFIKDFTISFVLTPLCLCASTAAGIALLATFAGVKINK